MKNESFIFGGVSLGREGIWKSEQIFVRVLVPIFGAYENDVFFGSGFLNCFNIIYTDLNTFLFPYMEW